jgi:hypothetical protein
MPGTFSKASRPRRPGAYTNFQAATPLRVPPATGTVVCVPLVHDWGPFKTPTLVDSFAEFQAIFGDSTTPGRLAVRQAFQGEGLDDRPGAGGVIVYRFGAAAAAKATRVLQNTTPANALTLTARYEGVRGNRLTVTVQTNALDATKKDVILLLDGNEVERYTWTAVDVTGLVAQINAVSQFVVATQTITGVALGNVTAQAFTGGSDGSTITAGDWASAQAALEFERFGILAPYDLTDGPTLTALASWVNARNLAGQRFITVVGGGAGESVATANARSLSINSPWFINVGGFSVSDATENVGVLTTSQLAPRIAGILAARGERRSMTFARLAGLTMVTSPTSADVDSAFSSGTIVLTRDSDPTAPVHVEKSLTTWTTTSNTAQPYSVYRNPKFVRTMMGLDTDLTDYASAPGLIGELGVNDKTRAAVVARMASLLRDREERGVIRSGWTVGIDQDPPPSDDDEFIALRYGLKFMRSVEQVFNTIVVA